MDWGVEDQEEDIYQTPVMDAQPPGGIRKSETTGDIAGGGSTLIFVVTVSKEGKKKKPFTLP